MDDILIRVKFLEENQLNWEYRVDPNGQTGRNATEQIERTQIRSDVLSIRWKEVDGTHVINVFDLGKMMMYVNFITPDGDRFTSQGKVVRVNATC